MNKFPTLHDADLIPEDYQMRLMAWRDEFTRGYFEIGDIANEIVMLNIKNGMKVENAAIYSAVGRFCGKSGRTVRDYAEISAFFPSELRKNYDILPFSHFRFAKTCGKDWEAVLEYSLMHPDASEDKLTFEFNKSGANMGVAAGADDALEAVAESISDSSVAASVAASVAVGTSLSGIFALANLISQAEQLLSGWDMRSSTRRKLLLAIDGLKDVLEDLSSSEPALDINNTGATVG